MIDSQPEDWARYWRNPYITTFGNVFPSNYDGSFLEFWRTQLQGELHDVVDIACGNGALTWIADQCLNRDGGAVSITGVDSAAIDPFGALGRNPAATPRVRFLGDTPVEAMPFAAASIDLAISQFGLEYTDVEASVPEIARILRPSGRLACVLHHRESRIIRNAASQLADIEAVLDLAIDMHALAFLELGRRTADAAARARSAEFRARAARLAQLTDQVRAIVRGYKAASPIHLYMERITGVFASGTGVSIGDPAARIAGAREQLGAQARRLRHMQSAALDAPGVAVLAERVCQAGFAAVTTGALGYGDEPEVAVTLVATRR